MSRSRRARLWLAWGLRDARRRWLQVASIGLLIALGVGMYSAMSSMSGWRTASADASFAKLHVHDLRVSLAQGGYAPEGALARALAAIPDRASVSESQERLVAPLQIEAGTARRPILVPGRIVGAGPPAPVDRTFVVRGRPLRPGESAVELERNFAQHYDLPASGRIRLTGGRLVPYVGQALAPEYFVVTAPGADFGAEASFAVVFSSLRTAQALTGQPGRVDELVLRSRDPRALPAIRSQLERSLHSALPGVGFTFTGGDQEAAHRLIYKDAEGDQQMMDVFAFLLLGAAAFAAFNLVSRTVESQRREIGIGMALGVRPRALALRPLLLGGQVALMGVALGIPAGFAADAWLRSVMESFFPLPVLRTPLNVAVFARAAGLGVGICLVATALPLRRALKMSPVEAVRVGARAAAGSGLAGIARGLRLPGGSLANMPLRNVLRAPRRTLLTVLGVAAVVAITLALAGMIDSFDTTLDASRAEALAGSRARIAVDLAAPQPTAVAERTLASSGVVADQQPSLRLAATAHSRTGHVDVFLEAVAPGRLWHPTLREGALPAARPGLLIAQSAARDLHVKVGDRLAVSYPLRTRTGAYTLTRATLPVSGVHTSPLRFVAYVNAAGARTMGLAGIANRISVSPAPGSSRIDVERRLLAFPSVTAVQGAAASTEAVQQTMSQFTDVLVITVAIAMVMAFLIAYNSASINAEERTREHATMFAYGVAPARVLRGSVVEALIAGTLATAIGVAGGYGILRWMIDSSMRTTIPDLGTLVSISATTFVLAFLAGVVAVSLAPLLTLRRLRAVDIPSALRIVE